MNQNGEFNTNRLFNQQNRLRNSQIRMLKSSQIKKSLAAKPTMDFENLPLELYSGTTALSIPINKKWPNS